MNKEDLQALTELIKETGKEAVEEVIEKAEKELIAVVQTELIEKIKDRKTALIQKLTAEIAETNNLAVKARDYLYILIVRIIECFYEKIEKKVFAE